MRLILFGHSGRLGSEIVGVCNSITDNELQLIKLPRSPMALLENALTEKAVLCDVSKPEGTETLLSCLHNLSASARANLAGLVIGVTGQSSTQNKQIVEASAQFPVCMAPNFSRGVFLFEQILQAKTATGLSVADLARHLGFDIACSESHHTRKKDAPSGTAKALAKAAGLAEDRISSIRVGEVVGEHTLFLSGEAEELRLTHTAHARRLFAIGAVDLCKRIYRKNPAPGIFSVAEFF